MNRFIALVVISLTAGSVTANQGMANDLDEKLVGSYSISRTQLSIINNSIKAGVPVPGIDVQVVQVLSDLGGAERIASGQKTTDRHHGTRITATALALGADPSFAFIAWGHRQATPSPTARRVCLAQKRLTLDCKRNAATVAYLVRWTFHWHPNLDFVVATFNLTAPRPPFVDHLRIR